MLDSKLLENYMQNFYGYGNWKSDIWFIGIEEGGGNSKAEIQKRLESWNRYQTDLIDNREHSLFLDDKKVNSFFVPSGKKNRVELQSTWTGLIKLQLAYEGITEWEENDKRILREIQMNDWGRLNSNHVISNLLPLASPKSTDWKYHEWSDLNCLVSRKDYLKIVAPIRLNYLKSKIEQNKPKAIILYGRKMMKYWNELVRVDIKNTCEKIHVGKQHYFHIKNDNTNFFQIQHSSMGVPDKMWLEIGQIIRNS